MAETVESRLDFVESEIIAAGDIAGRFVLAREALDLIHSILVDLTRDLENASAYESDLARLKTLSEIL